MNFLFHLGNFLIIIALVILVLIIIKELCVHDYPGKISARLAFIPITIAAIGILSEIIWLAIS